MLQPESYPHIFDAIASLSPASSLLALRGVSRAAAEAADALLFENALLILDWAGRVTLQAKGGPRMHGDLATSSPASYTYARIARVLPRIRHLTLAGAYEFGCIPSHTTVSALVAKMYSLEHITLIPDPYGRKWRGAGGLRLSGLDTIPASAPCSCGVRRIPRPPTPPPSSPYESRATTPEAETSDLVIRTHAGRRFDPALLGVLGRARELTLVLALWSPGWTSSPAHRQSAVAAASHAALVTWRYASACAFVAGAMEPTLAPGRIGSANSDGTCSSAGSTYSSSYNYSSDHPRERNVTVVGLEQVHPAYLDHEWMPDYEALTCFRNGVKLALHRLAATSQREQQRGRERECELEYERKLLTPEPEELHFEELHFSPTHDEDRRGRSRGRAPLAAPAHPVLEHTYAAPLSDTHTATPPESESAESVAPNNLVDPVYFADLVGRLRDYASSRSPTRSPSASRSPVDRTASRGPHVLPIRSSSSAMTSMASPIPGSAAASHSVSSHSVSSRSVSSARYAPARSPSVLPHTAAAAAAASRPAAASLSPSPSRESLYARMTFVTLMQHAVSIELGSGASTPTGACGA